MMHTRKRLITSALTVSALLLFVSANFLQDDKIPSVTIGEQTWMTQNLNVAHFRNGDEIFHARTAAEWAEAGEKKQPAWCHFQNDTNNGIDLGRLYNWYAVVDPRGLAPDGWHIPKHSEWEELIAYLGGTRVAGEKMKTTYGWAIYQRATNEAMFWALPGGTRFADGTFSETGRYTFWWSSTQDGNSHAWARGLNNRTAVVAVESYQKRNGFSVRCVKDVISKVNDN
jgi:uncharacterized protein (TIGR02145 family)